MVRLDTRVDDGDDHTAAAGDIPNDGIARDGLTTLRIAHHQPVDALNPDALRRTRHAVDEPLARCRIVQLPLVDDRDGGEPRRERRGEQTGLASTVDRHVEAAARRSRLEHVAVEIGGGERLDTARGEVGHRAREIVAHMIGDEDDAAAVASEIHRLARRAQTGFDFRTDRHPLDVLREHLGEEGVALVPTVVAHALAEQARGDPDAEASRLVGGHDLV